MRRRKSSRPASKKAKLPLLTAMEQAQLERDYEHFLEERALYEEMLEKGYRNNPRRARRNGEISEGWKHAAERLLRQSTGMSMDDFHYRAYLRAVIAGNSEQAGHLVQTPFIGALNARADLIDEYGKGKANPRRARPNRGPAQTQTAAFKRWFGDSKVVDENGQPKVVYHGTHSEPFYTFRRPEGRRGMDLYGPGFYFTTHQKTLDTFGNRVMPVYLRIENPVKGMSMTPTQIRKFWDAIRVTKFPNGYDATEDHARIREHMLAEPNQAFSRIINNVRTYLNAEDARQAILATGIDGVIIPANALGIDEYVVFDPRQIKSATENVGTFDPENADIRYNPRRRR